MPSHTYAAAGTYAVTLTVTDDDGASASATTTATISRRPGDTFGTGTAGKLVRWLDGSGALGDSNLSQSGGNIGVGIARPTQRLHVVGTYSGTSPLSVDRIGAFVNDGTPETHAVLAVIAGSNGVAGIDLGDTHNQNQSFIRYNNGALGEKLRFGIDNIERLTILSNGNVGVGAENPQSTLQVNGYVQLALTSGAPPAADCDNAAEYGRMKVDAVGVKIYVCTSAGWKSTALQ
jgi:PKD repeat protein